MNKNKRSLEEMTLEEKIAGLQAGAGMAPKKAMDSAPYDNRITEQDSEQARMVQQMLLQNSPTRGVVAPTAQDLMLQDADMQSQMDELGEGVEVPAPASTRFRKLLGK